MENDLACLKPVQIQRFLETNAHALYNEFRIVHGGNIHITRSVASLENPSEDADNETYLPKDTSDETPAVRLMIENELGMVQPSAELVIFYDQDNPYDLLRDTLIAMQMYVDYGDSLRQSFTPCHANDRKDCQKSTEKIQQYMPAIEAYVESLSDPILNKRIKAFRENRNCPKTIQKELLLSGSRAFGTIVFITENMTDQIQTLAAQARQKNKTFNYEWN